MIEKIREIKLEKHIKYKQIAYAKGRKRCVHRDPPDLLSVGHGGRNP